NGRHKRGDVRACQIFKIMVFGDDITIKWLLETGGGPINCAVHFQYYGVDKISLLVELDAVVLVGIVNRAPLSIHCPMQQLAALLVLISNPIGHQIKRLSELSECPFEKIIIIGCDDQEVGTIAFAAQNAWQSRKELMERRRRVVSVEYCTQLRVQAIKSMHESDVLRDA